MARPHPEASTGPISSPSGAPTGGSSSGSSRTGLLIGVVAGLVILALAAGAFVFFGGDDDGGAVAFDPTAPKGSAANPHDVTDLVRISYTDPDSGAATEWTVEVLSGPSADSAAAGDGAEAVARVQIGLSEADAPKSLSTITLRAAGPDGDRTDAGDCDSVTTPLAFDRLLAVNETADGEVCWTVPSDDVSALTMIVEVDGIDGAIHMKLQ